MMRFLRPLFLFAALSLAKSPLDAKEETLLLYEEHRVAIAVPEGFSYTRSFGEDGSMSVKIADPRQEINLQISFLPDPEERLATPRARKELLAENFQPYVESSVEKAMQFEELAASTGHGTYCVFTDASLVGKAELPPGEYLKATTGIKTWPGCAAIFTVLSNDTQSPAYRTALKILAESLREKAPQATL
jgi:hypothetical protein